jgi:hypothetical protein
MKYLVVSGLGLALALNASALSITPATADMAGNDTSFLGAGDVAALVGATSLTQLYLQHADLASDSGSFASSYSTLFDNVFPGDPADADIVYGGGSFITGFTRLWLYVKDGEAEPAYYLFNLNALGWDGTAELNLRAFWLGDGSITSLAIYGGNDTRQPDRIPDGGITLMLLGAALAGMGSVRRFSKA